MEFVDANGLIPTEPSVVRAQVEYFINLLEEKGDSIIPPIKVLKVTDYALVIDGHNRAYAFIKMGRSKIPCELLNPNSIPDHRMKYLRCFCKNILPYRRANGITGFEYLPIDESDDKRKERTLLEQASTSNLGGLKI